VCRVDALPEFGGKANVSEYAELPGGQVATAALAAAGLGLQAAYVGAVGDDADGQVVLEPLRAGGVDVSGVKRVAGARTQLALIVVERAGGERIVLWHRDPALALRPSDLRREAIESARALHLDAGDPEMAAWAAGVAREAGVPVFLDVDTPSPDLGPLLDRVDFPIVPRGFAESLGEDRSLRGALMRLGAHGGRAAVVTLGAAGALARCGEEFIESPAYSVEAIDTTGAGDVFRGAFVWAVLQGWDVATVLDAANAAAAMSCRALGAQGGLPSREELEAFLKDNEPGPWRGEDFAGV
jgi:sugar/nucleoside kinase (ribokinase family)